MTVPLLAFGPVLIAAILVACWKPKVALLLPLVFHAGYLLRSRISFGDVDLPTTLFELLIGVAVIVGVFYWRANVVHALRGLPRPLLILLLLFIASASLSAAIAPHPKTAWGQWKAFVIEPLAYAAVLLPLLRTSEGQTVLARSLLWGGILSAGLALAVGTQTADGRLRGIYDVPNSLALVLAPLTAFSTVLAFRAASPLRRLSRVAVVVMVPALFLTQSLGGVLSAAAGGAVAAFQQRRTVVIVFFAALLGGGLLLVRATDSSAPARLQIWRVAGALIRDHPLLGTGLGTFEPRYQEKLHALLRDGGWKGPVLEWVVRDPHNIVLSFWLNTGLLGLLAMGAIVLMVLVGRGVSDTSPSVLKTAARAALVALLVFGLVDVPYWKNDLAVLWWAYLLLAAAPARQQASEKTRASSVRAAEGSGVP